MKQTIFAFFLVLSIQTYGQGCSLVSGTKNKETGVYTEGGVVNSKDYYSLLIHRKSDPKNPDDSLDFSLSLHAASRVMLSDSLLNTKAKLELTLTDGSRIVITNADCFNDPIGLGNSIGFSAKTGEDDIRQISLTPILKIKVINILETEFSPRSQKQQQKIALCLLKKKE